MEITRHNPGPRMSQAVEHNGVVYLAGQVADDRNSDITEQTSQVLAKIDALLATAGSDKSKLLWAQLWVTDMRNFGAMNEVWDAWIDTDNPPVRAGLCSDLAAPGYLVEIMVMAAK
ncbi:MAG: RidA family protein [Alphaproteobacteria bacterium]|jgi:enamine deaminase RidA (YjgF/YER057c/UK114 family)|nr:RidA family protein [Alphaproteobacteria bacterium]|tara:strand:+ start:254 stop:601 length:348 start_codon:yes stop_codon:yes gene_type:complete